MDTPAPSSAHAFHAFEHAGWEAVPRRYDDAFTRLTAQSIEPLLDAAAVRQGTRVLDVASGPGHAAAAAARRGASAVGLDFSAAMVAEARRLHPGVEFQEGDAEELPFDAGCFDAVVMGFGLLHMPRPERAVAEAHRVLRPQGRFALTVWAQPDQAVGLALVLQAIQRHGDLAVPLPAGPPFFRFSDPAECERVLCEGGFSTPQVTVVPQVWRLRAPEDLMEIMLHGTVRTAALLKAQDARALERIRRDVVDAAAAYRHGDAVELPMPAVLAQAVKR